MEEHISEESSEIIPESEWLSNHELIPPKTTTPTTIKSNKKRAKSDNSLEEREELEKLRDDLRKQLSYPRIEGPRARTQAEWDADKKLIKMLRIEGKFQNFGYTMNKIHYLDNYEALFLLESNRLELLFNGVIVSIEQAYILLLGEEKSEHYDNYLVYSTLTRAGYIVKKYRNIPYSVTVTDEDCIWEILQASLDDEHKIASHIEKHEKFHTIKGSMEKIVSEIAHSSVEKLSEEIPSTSSTLSMPSENTIKKEEHQVATEIEKEEEEKTETAGESSSSSDGEYIDFDRKFPAKRKRKSEDSGNNGEARNRRLRQEKNITVADYNKSRSSRSYLDVLKKEPVYEEFKDIFESLQMIPLRGECDYGNSAMESSKSGDESIRDLEIIFDIYLPRDNPRKLDPKPPKMRIMILSSSESFPNRTEISKAYHSQLYKVPLVIIAVSESKQLQAFVYHFT